jgi:hypothetical protein
LTEENREPGPVSAGTAAGGESSGSQVSEAPAEQGSPAPPAGGEVRPADLVPGTRTPPDTGKPDTGKQEAAPKAAKGTDEEHAELERLRAEVRELRERAAGESRQSRPAGRRWHAALAAVAITIGCVLAPVSVLAVWASNQVSNTDRYVANVAPLISDPSIQSALSANAGDQNRCSMGTKRAGRTR